MRYVQLKFTCVLNRTLFSWLITPENMQLYSKPSFINKACLPRCILYWWINFLIILTQNDDISYEENIQNLPVKISKNDSFLWQYCFFFWNLQ